MTPEERTKLNELYEWMQSRLTQQISYPLDEASKNTIAESGSVLSAGAGSATLTQQIALTGNPQNINVPAAYAGTSKFTDSDGVEREYPYIA